MDELQKTFERSKNLIIVALPEGNALIGRDKIGGGSSETRKGVIQAKTNRKTLESKPQWQAFCSHLCWLIY